MRMSRYGYIFWELDSPEKGLLEIFPRKTRGKIGVRELGEDRGRERGRRRIGCDGDDVFRGESKLRRK